MNLATHLADTRARFMHAADNYTDDAMEAFMPGHVARLDAPPPCETIADAIAVAEELSREGTADDMGADPRMLAGLLIRFLRSRG